MALFVAVALPVGYFLVGLHGAQALASAKAAVHAEELSQIAGKALPTWHRQYAPEAPILTETRAIDDSGELVGYVDIHYSLRPLLVETGWIAIIAVVLAAGVFIVFRQQPLRALDHALRTLAEEQQRAAAILGAIGDGVIATDTAGRIYYLNPLAESLLGRLNAVRQQPLEAVFELLDYTSRARLPDPARALLDGAAGNETRVRSAAARSEGTGHHVSRAAADPQCRRRADRDRRVQIYGDREHRMRDVST